MKTIYFRTENWDCYRIDSHGNKFKNGRCINDVIGTLGEVHSTPLPPKDKQITTPVILGSVDLVITVIGDRTFYSVK